MGNSDTDIPLPVVDGIICSDSMVQKRKCFLKAERLSSTETQKDILSNINHVYVSLCFTSIGAEQD